MTLSRGYFNFYYHILHIKGVTNSKSQGSDYITAFKFCIILQISKKEKG